MLGHNLIIVRTLIDTTNNKIDLYALADPITLTKNEEEVANATYNSTFYTFNFTNVDDSDDQIRLKVASQELDIDLGKYEEFNGGLYVGLVEIDGNSAKIVYSKKLIQLKDTNYNSSDFSEGSFIVNDDDNYEDSLAIKGSVSGDEFRIVEIKYNPTEYEDDN